MVWHAAYFYILAVHALGHKFTLEMPSDFDEAIQEVVNRMNVIATDWNW